MYQNSEGTDAQAAEDMNAAESAPDEDVIDADFTEVDDEDEK